MGGEARRASLCSCLFLGSFGLQPKCSWRVKLLPRKAVLPAARCVEEPARCTCVCLRVFSVCVSEAEKSAENVNEKSFLHRVQETLENVHKGIDCDLRLGTSIFEMQPGGSHVQPGSSTAIADPLPRLSHTCSFVLCVHSSASPPAACSLQSL